MAITSATRMRWRVRSVLLASFAALVISGLSGCTVSAGSNCGPLFVQLTWDAVCHGGRWAAHGCR